MSFHKIEHKCKSSQLLGTNPQHGNQMSYALILLRDHISTQIHVKHGPSLM